MRFALNQVTTPRFAWKDFLDVAKACGFVGVEFRNDLGRPLFDGERAEIVRDTASQMGLQIFGLSQIYPFNQWDKARAEELKNLLDLADKSGAETVSLIPLNEKVQHKNRLPALGVILQEVAQIAWAFQAKVLIEPLGFQRASLRYKLPVVEEVERLGLRNKIGLVHDTFHHFLSQEDSFYPEATGIVHISGAALPPTGRELTDEDRVLIDHFDKLGNIKQLARLMAAGYSGPVSMESFSPMIQHLDEPAPLLRKSLRFIQTSLDL